MNSFTLLSSMSFLTIIKFKLGTNSAKWIIRSFFFFTFFDFESNSSTSFILSLIIRRKYQHREKTTRILWKLICHHLYCMICLSVTERKFNASGSSIYIEIFNWLVYVIIIRCQRKCTKDVFLSPTFAPAVIFCLLNT